jgi:hypothetical protein
LALSYEAWIAKANPGFAVENESTYGGCYAALQPHPWPPDHPEVAAGPAFCVISRVQPSGPWQASSLRRFAAKSPRLALLLASLIVAAASTSWLLLQSPNFFWGYDFVRTHFFYKAYFREAILAARLPLWNPFVGLGRPFMADIETASLYPPNLLVLPLGVIGGTAAAVFLHQTLAIYGGVRLGEAVGASAGTSWVVGTGFALASPFTARLATGILEGYFSLCWLPALLLFGVRLQDRWSAREGARFAVCVGLTILAGHPPFAYVEFLGVFVFLVFRQRWPSGAAERSSALRNALGLGAAGVVGVGIAGAQLLPFLELVRQGNRPLNSAGFAVANGMPPASWLSLLFPTSEAFRPNWEYDLHCGLVPLFAALGGLILLRDRNVRAFAGMGLAGALLAAGDRTPILGWITHLLPGAGALRIPSRYGLWLTASILGIGALALSRRSVRAVPLVVLGFAASVACAVWLEPYVVRGQGGAGEYYLSHVGALAAAAALVVLWHLSAPSPRLSVLVGSAAAAFCAANLLWAIRLEASVYSPYGFPIDDAAVRAALKKDGLFVASRVPPRVSFDSTTVRENAGMIQGFSSYNGYVAPVLGRTWGYLHTAAGMAESPTDFVRLPKAVAERSSRLDGINLAAAYDPGSRTLSFPPTVDPRAYLVFRVVNVSDWKAAEDTMAARHDFHTTALVERGSAPDFAPPGGNPPSEAVITGFAPERVTVTTRAGSPGVLVLAEAWYPGWEATVGDKPAKVFPVNGWMRGVTVPAGQNEVVFTYRSRYLGAGAALSLASVAVVFLLLYRARPGQTVSRSL